MFLVKRIIGIMSAKSRKNVFTFVKSYLRKTVGFFPDTVYIIKSRSLCTVHS